MKDRNTAIIATVVAAVLCGCPGLLSLCFGLMFAVVSQIPGADINIFNSNDPTTALASGIGMLCVGIVFVAIPIVVGFILLRKKPAAATSIVDVPPPPDEPIPPAS